MGYCYVVTLQLIYRDVANSGSIDSQHKYLQKNYVDVLCSQMTKNESCCTNMKQKCSFEVSFGRNLYKINCFSKLFLIFSSCNLDFFTIFALDFLCRI